jgi:hypothetical protein
VRGRGASGPYLLAWAERRPASRREIGRREELHGAACSLQEEDKKILQKSPGLRGFLEILKIALVLQDFVISTCLEHCEIIQGLPC